MLDLNTIDKKSLEKAIQIFGLYKRYKDKRKKKSRLLRTLVKRNIRKIPMEIEIYYIVLKPELENNQVQYSEAMKIITKETVKTKTYCISPNSPSKTADLLIIIEALKLKEDVRIKTNRIKVMTKVKHKKIEKKRLSSKREQRGMANYSLSPKTI